MKKKGLVSIVMSIYNPKIEYIIKQLDSINEQDYSDIEVIIWDDNPDSGFEESILQKHITNYPYKYEKTKKNLGYAKAFEKLTTLAKGEYIAFCDQDDIWLKKKVSKMVSELKREGVVLVTADRALIDGQDKIFVKSVRHGSGTIGDRWNTGDDMLEIAVFTTCAIGMNTMMKTSVAESLLPIPEDVAHDKWFSAGACVKGKVVFLDEVLALYRRHGENVSGTLVGIHSKKEYYEKRVKIQEVFSKAFLERFTDIDVKKKKRIKEFTDARVNRRVFEIFKHREIDPDVARFEIVMSLIPNCLFSFFIKLVQLIA